jgi:hypothetical protein
MPDMAPKFMDPLRFQSDHSLDVCGPTNKANGGTQLNITRIVIADHKGELMDRAFEPAITSKPDTEWEANFFAGADGTLLDGPGIGLAIAFVNMPGGATKDASWAQAIHLTHKQAAAASGNGAGDAAAVATP